MKRLLFVATLFVAGVIWADRTDVWSAASVRVHEVNLYKLTDGGCAVQAHASYTKTDGGSVTRHSRMQELSGANRTACLDIVDTKAPVLFKADEGL